ncbi:MAG: DUF4360 domain-containing protein [Nostoc sp. NMS1]|uniref:DUF4360 domain-containing protein n=1 Tax=unclassified Nostoc TaxID=2593658 RepID=UPI0025E2176C|nr:MULTISPECIES: DUF4360 domain-containing protein [unclassified Nostoc]MBN3909250.1 DUF4360 domain-containing protein [Nostoc sp. NMS1]MBN3993334.1 DUF4360 domain-containing protein [Nostoc sp. NMS2]
MNFKQVSALLCVSTVLSMNVIASKALAQEQPSIQFLKAIGSGGCAIGDQLTGSDGRTLSIFLDNMIAENGKRQKCLLRVDTIIPSGFHVQDVQILYQGSTEVPKGKTSLARSYIFAGGVLGVAKAKPAPSEFTSSNPLFQTQDDLTVASASCTGGQGQLGINIIAQSSAGTSIVLDSVDANIGDVKLHIDIAPC